MLKRIHNELSLFKVKKTTYYSYLNNCNTIFKKLDKKLINSLLICVKKLIYLISYQIKKMLRTIVVFAPIIAALAWVVFNIQKPAREQFNRDFLGKD